ncbi:carbohydrate ABC transporter permease [Candidatus Galacturonibacter soehngenii]|uniref:Sugar ABC transporter permease n=1 Tax=Candidatus Galacturonatibacter soehngenii TaxID=2307010 RepID=A0A7V7QJ97_9FIRM|nr:sugar ABC transporter permease [Candidatus Galacturonibacter soehngenii]KAB1437635.1 sugar ABC transporter permease [Candidatus Galacturonibacter soehngenii]MBA4686861.1 sugar ABC transporter permease [Candidatus Galacturonibacter soehngenii]
MKKKNGTLPWRFSLPSMVLITMIIIFPIAFTLYISFTNMNLYHWDDYRFIGMNNYIRALTKIDSGFLSAIVTTIIWTVLNMVLQIVISFFIALGLNIKGLKLGRLYKTLLMFPWAMPAYISILLWRVGMYNTEYGLLNKFITAIGLPKVEFLSENIPAFFSCMVLNLWMALPFLIMMMDGALQSVDHSYYESAKLDGAGWWARNIYITIPCIWPIIAPAIIMTTFTTFKQFDIIYLLTMQKGSLTGATLNTVITYAYQNAFVSNNYGLSSAVSIVIFGFIIFFSLFINRGIKGENI